MGESDTAPRRTAGDKRDRSFREGEVNRHPLDLPSAAVIFSFPCVIFFTVLHVIQDTTRLPAVVPLTCMFFFFFFYVNSYGFKE